MINQIADGVRDFDPNPVDTKEVCRRMYRARRTLLLKFMNDTLDESEDIEKVLKEANTIMRMKRPMIEMTVDLKIIQGTHVTPLTQNLFADPPPAISSVIPDVAFANPVKERLQNEFLSTVDKVKLEILYWLNNSN